MAGGARSKSDFPSLNSSEYSQAPIDQQALTNIKKTWDKHAKKWPDDVRQTVLGLLKVVKQTVSNLKAPSSHKVWKDPNGWNFGHWVVMNAIYEPERLAGMKHQLREKYPHIDFNKMDGPGLPHSESDGDSVVDAPITVKGSKGSKGSDLLEKAVTKSPIRSSSRASDDQDTAPRPLKRSARIDKREKRRRDAAGGDSDDEASTTSNKRGRSIGIKKELEFDHEGEHRRHAPQVLQDFRIPGPPAATPYSTGNAGIVDSRYRQMGGDRHASGGYSYPPSYRMGSDPQASGGYSYASRDHRSPYLERDPGQRGRMPIAALPANEEIEPAAIVRIRQEMNARLQDQQQSHYEELQLIRGEMRAMRSDFEERIFRFHQQHEKAIVDLANEASLAGHDSV